MSGDGSTSDISVPAEIGKSGQVVLELCDNLPIGTHIYFDNYFASKRRLLDFENKRFSSYICTLRGGRKAGADKEMKTEAEMRSLE